MLSPISTRFLARFGCDRGLLPRTTGKRWISNGSRVSGKPVRVRFAPSPTGLLHLGGFRTALINYLFALKHGGKFILRIEDTDQTRLVPGAVEMIEKDLQWLEIQPDEGPSTTSSYGPYTQSQRLSIYGESITSLLDSGHAYECFCSETRLDLIRREALRSRQVPRYDNKCRDLTRDQVKAKKAAGDKFCIRFKLQPERVKLHDLVHGLVEFDLTDRNYEGDLIIIKSDGFPTYHFANVVDDHYMDISHVLRGIEWQISTPKHLQLYRAFKWESPQFGHLPNVVNKDGTKLSKRQGDISMKHYRDKLYYPRALTNFVTKSGGGFSDHSVDKIFSHQELANLFDISKVNTAACRLDFELLSKLNQVELSYQVENHLEFVVDSLSQALLSSTSFSKPSNSTAFPRTYLESILKWCPERVCSILDLFSKEFSYIWSIPGPDSASKITHSPETLSNFANDLEKFLSNHNSDVEKQLSSFIKEYASSNDLKFKLLMADVRLILCGAEKGPPIADLISLFGSKDSIKRIRKGVEQLSQISSTPKSASVRD